MELADFPYRVLPDDQARELHKSAEAIRQKLDAAVAVCVDIGKILTNANNNLHRDIYTAWLFAEFGWKRGVADAFETAENFATNGNSFQPKSAENMAEAVLSVRAVCACQVAKARRLVESYRAIVRGDVVFSRWPSSAGKPRRLKRGARIRGRVLRREIVRQADTEDPEELS